jgi:flagellar biosynthesis/type III secretory pathway M-ring protein FliF/YscJ
MMLWIQKAGLASVIIINFAIIASIILWSLESDKTLLIGSLHTTQAIRVIDVLEQQDIEYNLSVADAPKVIDILDENKIWYRMNLPRHMLYVWRL